MDQLRFGKDGAIGIIDALAKASQAIGAIDKDKKNEKQGFAYRSIDAVMSGIHDALATNNIVLTVESVLLISTERKTNSGGVAYYKEKDFTFTFWHIDASALSTTVTGAAADSGDKVDNKCISIALKYALTTIFMIPLKTDDPDAHTPEKTKPSAKATNKQDGNTPDVISPAAIAIAGQKFRQWYTEAYPQYTPDIVKKHGQDFVAGRFGGKAITALTKKEGEQLVQYIELARVDSQNARIAQETKAIEQVPAPVPMHHSDAIAPIDIADIAADEPELVKQVVEDHGTEEELEKLNEILETPIVPPAPKPTPSGVMGDEFDKLPF